MKSYSYIISGASGKPIAADLSTPDGPGNYPLVIFVHGFKGFKDWGTHNLTAKYFVEKGFQFLKFNFSHNGISLKDKEVFDDLEAFGQNTFSKELFDLDEVLTFALSGEEFKAPERVFLIGHSRGGGICIIQAAEDHRISGLVTWASVNRFSNMWQPEQESQWKKDGVIYSVNMRTKQQMPLNVTLLEDLEHNSELLEIDSAAKKVSQPWLIIHGTADPGVAVAQAKELNRQNAKSQLLLIEEGDHVFGAKHPWTANEIPEKLKEVCDETISFLRKY